MRLRFALRPYVYFPEQEALSQVLERDQGDFTQGIHRDGSAASASLKVHPMAAGFFGNLRGAARVQ